ncbi:hypothetical protein PMAYCL1PPCAC_06719, partial [Pristionchus mayeri]
SGDNSDMYLHKFKLEIRSPHRTIHSLSAITIVHMVNLPNDLLHIACDFMKMFIPVSVLQYFSSHLEGMFHLLGNVMHPIKSSSSHQLPRSFQLLSEGNQLVTIHSLILTSCNRIAIPSSSHQDYVLYNDLIK